MPHDPTFQTMIRDGYTLVSISVLYYLPDYRNLLNEFVWQTLDLSPTYPRIYRFVDYWKKEIDATIKEIVITENSHLNIGSWTNGILLSI